VPYTSEAGFVAVAANSVLQYEMAAIHMHGDTVAVEGYNTVSWDE
jgi:hypothetical protein